MTPKEADLLFETVSYKYTLRMEYLTNPMTVVTMPPKTRTAQIMKLTRDHNECRRIISENTDRKEGNP